MGNFRQTMRKNQTNEKHGIRDKELDGLIIRWWTTKNRISELEDMSRIIQTVTQKEKVWKQKIVSKSYETILQILTRLSEVPKEKGIEY